MDGLGSDDFAEREQAQRALDRLGDLAAAALRHALAGKQRLETRRRIEALLRKLATAPLSAEQRRHIRAVQALENVGNAAARDLLRALARGAAGAADRGSAARRSLAWIAGSDIGCAQGMSDARPFL